VTQSELPGAGQQPLSDDQPSLAITYLIATNGIFPATFNDNSFDPFTQTLGQIAEFAGDFAPSGWALADGQLLSIQANLALFAVIGTAYGGDGKTTFALPDLDGRTTIGAGGVFPAGDATGFNSILLTTDEVSIAPLTVPESSTWAMMAIGFIALSFAGYRKTWRGAYKALRASSAPAASAASLA
jgi:microcystin-dependent protein